MAKGRMQPISKIESLPIPIVLRDHPIIAYDSITLIPPRLWHKPRKYARKSSPPTGQIWRQDKIIDVRPTMTRVLWALLSRVGKVVEYWELAEFVWPDADESPLGISATIKVLRAQSKNALKDAGLAIETWPIIGHRVVILPRPLASVQDSRALPG